MLALIAAAVLGAALGLFGLKRISRPLSAGMEPHGGERLLPPDRIWMFVTAITLHNLPEGLAVGVSFAGSDPAAGSSTALAIGLQNMTEGLAVAALLAGIGLSRGTAVLTALASGLVEPVSGFIGAAFVSAAHSLLPWALGAAAGAMVQVIAADVVPAIGRLSCRLPAVQAATGGVIAMTLLDTVLG